MSTSDCFGRPLTAGRAALQACRLLFATLGASRRRHAGGTGRLVDTRLLKQVAIVSALVPAVLLAWDTWRGQLGVNAVNFVIRTTGLIGLILITLSLVVTPLRELTGWGRIVAARRALGVIGFGYLVLHVAVFVLFDREASLSSTLHELVTRRYLWFGTGALALMVPLALTSSDAMVARLGPARWKRLHRLAYPMAIGAVVHYYLLVKSDVTQPLAFAGAVGGLLAWRGVRTAWRRRSPLLRARVSSWAGELIVSRIVDESPDVRTFRFAAVDGRALPFTWRAGQYLTVALTIDGRRVNRSYTIASSSARRDWCEISVKAAVDGRGSRHLHETWYEGQRVRVTGPGGAFVFEPGASRRVVLIAGGIGITPMMAAIRSLTDAGWRGEIHLLYSVRTVADIVFRDELLRRSARFPALHVRVFVTRDIGAAWDGPIGPITRQAIAACVPDIARLPVRLCGPAPMMAAMRAHLTALGVPDAAIRQEAFVSRPDVDATPAFTTGTDVRLPDGPVGVVFARAGRSVEVAPGCTVLEAAEAAGIAIASECRSGICGQCRTRLVSGRVAMEVQDALGASDRARGLMLACQARPLEPLEIDA
jgi:ferredoxin-NADP reductase/DMSO/TMAO reductase YedYZ heme-binding membrane subunit